MFSVLDDDVPDLVYLDFSSDESDDEVDFVDEEEYDPFFSSENLSRYFEGNITNSIFLPQQSYDACDTG